MSEDTRLRSAEFTSIARAYVLASYMLNKTPVHLPEGPALVRDVRRLPQGRFKVVCELLPG